MIWTLNPPDERLQAERHAIRARYWLWLLLTLALLLAVKAVLVGVTELPRLILLPEAVTLAAGLLIPLAVCAVKGVKLPLDEAQRGQANVVLDGAYCGMLAVLLISEFVTLSFVRGLGGWALFLPSVIAVVVWDRCETELFRAGLILWGGNERRRRGKKRLTLFMLLLGAALIIVRIVALLSASGQDVQNFSDLIGGTIWLCVLLCVIHGRIVSRRDQGDNIADKLEERAKREAERDEE